MPRIIKSAKGTFNSATVTVDSSGRVIAGESGSGGAVMTPKLFETGPASGTYTSNGNQMIAYAASGGGGGGGCKTSGLSPSVLPSFNRDGGTGGYGVIGMFTSDITPPFSQPYAVGAGGSAGSSVSGNNSTSGTAGGATSIATLFSLNGGNGGGPNNGNNNEGTQGTSGNVGSGTFLATAPQLNGSKNRYGSTNSAIVNSNNPGPSPRNAGSVNVGQIGSSSDMAFNRSGFMISGNAFSSGGRGGLNSGNFGGGQIRIPTQSGKPGALLIFDNGS